MISNIRHAIYLLIGIVAVINAYPPSLQYAAAGGNFWNPVEFFAAGIAAGGAAAALSTEMVAIWTVFLIWVIFDCRKIGLGLKWGVFFAVFSYLGVSFFFPLYLVVRERYLARRNAMG